MEHPADLDRIPCTGATLVVGVVVLGVVAPGVVEEVAHVIAEAARDKPVEVLS